MQLTLPAIVSAWGRADFATTVKQQLLSLSVEELLLPSATTQGGIVDSNSLDATILRSTIAGNAITIKAGIFFQEIVGGCNCHDDPATSPAYCEIEIVVTKPSATTTIKRCNE